MSNWYVGRAFSTLQKVLGDNVIKDKLLAKETTIRAGGQADIFAVADSFEHLRAVVETSKDWGLPLFIIGRGSNLLVSDSGFPGIVLRLGRDFARKEVDRARIKAGAGVSLPSLVQTAARHSLSGLCFGVGIPGSLGGALVMNAGAHGSSIGDVVNNVVVYTGDGELIFLERGDIKFEYRNGNFKKNDIIVEAALELVPGDTGAIKHRMEEYFAKRKSTQPLQFPNAGSVFKNPPGDSAGRLIEVAGCKAMRIGDAQVSDKHANFIVNRGASTAFEIFTLIRSVRQRVYELYGVALELEIELLGEFDEALMVPERD